MNDSAKIIRKIRDKGRFSCPDCSKCFVREATYIKHYCEPRKRKHEIQSTIIGKTALFYYQEWMRFRKIPPQPAENFIKSQHYYSLISFAKYAKQVGITNLQLFLHAMDKRDWITLPGMWRSEDAYLEFTKYIDVQIPPDKRVAATLVLLDKISEAADIDISNVFEVIEPGELIALIENRKLSLWFLLRSEKFYTYCESLSEEQQQIINNIIADGAWNKKLESNPQASERFREYALEVGL